MTIQLSVFTKPWADTIEAVVDRMVRLGVQGIELPIRPGYQVAPDNVAQTLPRAVKVLEGKGLKIFSVAAPLDDAIITACGEAGIPLVRTMVGFDLGKKSAKAAIAEARARYDQLIRCSTGPASASASRTIPATRSAAPWACCT